ncbi:MAG: hypothetical protein A2Y93_14300 [Chloroflexi bacterium RBG_13_68_17]|nr:MAG: hypothetical protein A2Y93_14300 [Chloroflexi bacterium RBG_13_68_17]
MTQASLILLRGRIYTSADGQAVEALAVRGDRVLLAGTNDDAGALAGPETETVDLDGRTVLPGLTDAHLHLQAYARHLGHIDCETSDLQECLERVRASAQRAAPDEWILGHGWNHNVWGAYGSAAALDAVTGGRPTYLTAKSLHCAWANSAALAAAGVESSTADPPGGRIERDAGGRPTGILFENATHLVSRCIPPPTSAQVTESIAAALESLVRLGLTCVHDFDGAACLRALQLLRDDGRLSLRVVKHIQSDQLEAALDLGLRTGFGDDWLRIGHLKLFADGALGPRTAWMLAPYDGEPDNVGMGQTSKAELVSLGRRAIPAGLALAVHAIGDRANREVLDAFELLQDLEAAGPLPRAPHRIEHVQLIHPSDMPRLARLGVVASMQPIHAPSDMLMADRYWGQRVRSAYAWRSLAAAGATLAFGSDAPVESPNPFWGLHAAVTRRRHDGSPGPDGWIPGERLSLSQALDAYTRGPARAAWPDATRGRLASGCLADLIILDQDPWALDPGDLFGLRPIGTVVGGLFRHREF